MGLDDALSPTLFKYLKKASALTLLALMIILFVDSYGFFRLERLNLEGLRFFIWAYVITNAGIASPLYYWREKSKEQRVSIVQRRKVLRKISNTRRMKI